MGRERQREGGREGGREEEREYEMGVLDHANISRFLIERERVRGRELVRERESVCVHI